MAVGSVEVGVVTRAEVAEARVLPVVGPEARVLPVVVTLGVVVAARKVAVRAGVAVHKLAVWAGVALEVAQPCRPSTHLAGPIHERPYLRAVGSSFALYASFVYLRQSLHMTSEGTYYTLT